MVMDSDGQNQRSITPAMRYLGNPSWSPDGTTIAFDHDANHDGLNVPAPRMMPDVATLDQLPPVTGMAGLPEYRRAGEVRVAWSGADQGRAELYLPLVVR